MSTSDGLLRRSETGAVDGAAPTPQLVAQPSPRSRASGGQVPWPKGAKVLVGLLITATVLAAVGAAVGLAAADAGPSENERALEDEVAILEGQVAALTTERDGSADAVEAIDAELATVRQQLEEARAAGDDATERTAMLEARIASLTDERTTAVADVARLEAALATERERAAAAIAERDALADRYPITFDALLGIPTTVGDYDVSLTQVHCAGLPSCGTAPALADMTIHSPSDGVLRFAIPGFAEGGLSWSGGAYHTVIDTNTAIPACDGTPRTARVMMTIFPNVMEIPVDGAIEFVNLRAVITIEAAATGTCPAVLAYHSAELSPHA